MRRFMIGIVSAAVLALSGISVSAQQALVKVKAGHLVALDMAPLFLAKENGCFKEQGLEVETIFFANPGDNNAALRGRLHRLQYQPFYLAVLCGEQRRAHQGRLRGRRLGRHGSGGAGQIRLQVHG